MSAKSPTNMSAATSTSTLSKECSMTSMKSSDTDFAEAGYFCQGPQHYENLAQNLHRHWESEQLCDVTFIAGCDGRRVAAHRIVLAAASPYFAAMFTGSLREVNESEITLQEVDGESLLQLIKYCYTGELFFCNS